MEQHPDVRMLAIDRHHCLAVYRHLNIQCWDETHVDAVQDNIERLGTLLEQSTGAIACLVVLEPDASPPDSNARRKLDELAELLMSRSTCLAYVYQGSGFRAAAIRGVMVALTLLGRRRVPTRIFATIPPALAFMTEHLSDTKAFGTPVERERAVAFVQDRFAARPRS